MYRFLIFAHIFTSIIQGREAESTIHNHRNINNSIPSHYNGQTLQLPGREGETTIHNDHRNIKKRIIALERTETEATVS